MRRTGSSGAGRSRTRIVPQQRRKATFEPRRRRRSAPHETRGSADPYVAGMTRAAPRMTHGTARDRRSAFSTTDTELSDIAAAANAGVNVQPVTGYSRPAASGTPSAL